MQKENFNTTNFTTVLARERIVENDLEQQQNVQILQPIKEKKRNGQNFIGFAIKRFGHFLPQFQNLYTGQQLTSIKRTLQNQRQTAKKQKQHLGQHQFNVIFGKDSPVQERNEKNRLVMRKIIEKNFLALVFESQLYEENYPSYLQKMLQMHYKLLDGDYFKKYKQKLP